MIITLESTALKYNESSSGIGSDKRKNQNTQLHLERDVGVEEFVFNQLTVLYLIALLGKS